MADEDDADIMPLPLLIMVLFTVRPRACDHDKTRAFDFNVCDAVAKANIGEGSNVSLIVGDLTLRVSVNRIGGGG